jgi:hypothetical protein
LPEEDEGIEVPVNDDHANARGRDGDHLMGVPFECDLCQFRNVKKRNPVLSNVADGYTLLGIRRVNLDVCGSRAPRTVKANLNRFVADCRSAEFTFELSDYLPQLGWSYVEDRVGMAIALITLNASLRPGRYANHLQYDTMRKTPTWFRHAHSAGRGYNVDTLYAQDEKRVHATTCVTSGEWFVRFKLGAKYRMGQIRRQDEAFTPDIIHALDKIAQDLWDNSMNEAEKRKLEELMVYVLMTFCGNLRGEEAPLVSLSGMRTLWEDSINSPEPFIMITLHGRFKGENELRWHCIPIPARTQSDLPTLKWFRRIMRRNLVVENRQNGWLFADEKGNRRKMGYYDPLLVELLDKVKHHFPGIIPEAVDPSDFSLWRSGRRGGTTTALSLGVPQSIIDLMGRWRTREAKRGTLPGLPMRQVYTQVKNAVSGMLIFAKYF